MPTNHPEAIQRRLDLENDTVIRAKRAYSRKSHGTVVENLERIEFRQLLDEAVDEFLPEVTAALDKIRLFAATGEMKKRPRPVSITTWERLGKVGETYDLSRLQLIRCVLELLAARYGDDVPDQQTES